jgi:hypothetical protein
MTARASGSCPAIVKVCRLCQCSIASADRAFGPKSIAFLDRLAQLLEGQGRANDGACAMDGKIFNSRGVYVGRVLGRSILDLRGLRIYDLKGINIYKLSGELVGHLPLDVRSSERRLDKSADKLFR